MTKVILINPPVYYAGSIPRILDVSYPPLGILYLAAVLRKEKISVKIIDVGVENQSVEETIGIIKQKKPVVVGITAMTPVLQGALILAKNIKEKYKGEVKIAIGGPHVSADGYFIKRNKYFDFAVQGESETTFLELIKNLLKGKTIKGVYVGKPVKNLDEIPWPARDLINIHQYLKRASLIATRGCPFHCYYCSRPAVSDLVRCRSPKDIINEMEMLYEDCDGDYLFQDDSLTIRRNHTIEFCQELLKRSKKFYWAGYTRVDLVDEELLKLMARAGCYSLTFGIESGNEKLRNDVIGKHFSNDKVKKAILLCKKYGIDADGFFMFGHPGETKEQVRETIGFILENPFNIIGVSIATPFPGSRLWDYAVAGKIIDFKFIDDFALGKKGVGYAGVYPVYVPKTLNILWLYEQRKKIMRQFCLRPNYVWRRLKRDLISWKNLKRDFVEGTNVLICGSSARAPYQKRSVR